MQCIYKLHNETGDCFKKNSVFFKQLVLREKNIIKQVKLFKIDQFKEFLKIKPKYFIIAHYYIYISTKPTKICQTVKMMETFTMMK